MNLKTRYLLALTVLSLISVSALSAITRTITFDKNDYGAFGAMNEQAIAQGSSKKLAACEFTKKGWKFAGWAIKADGVVKFSNKASYKMGKANVTLFAKWTPPKVFSLGDRGPAGGWIVYDKGEVSDGWRYLETAIVDQTPNEGTIWGTNEFDIPEANGTEIGTGQQNTVSIVKEDSLADKAADMCAEYSIVNGGVKYDDWFLPSILELNEMYVNLKASGIGGFIDDEYWSSSQVDIETAYTRDFGNGFDAAGQKKDEDNNVRAIRAF
jgi:uncharacterized repeat protein (TIGR02543 family)